MTFEQLAKRLRREVVANPKKGAFLGLMTVVALWFWAPLVAGWFANKDSGTTIKAAETDAATMAGFINQLKPSTPVAPASSPESPWHVLAEWMDRDSLKQAAQPDPRARDPFQIIVREVPKLRQPAKQEQLRKTVTPEALGLTLTGTVVGPGRRVAMINGKSYRQGDDVKLGAKNESTTFKLSQVESDRVVLEQTGRRFEIKLRTPVLSSQIELMGNNE